MVQRGFAFWFAATLWLAGAASAQEQAQPEAGPQIYPALAAALVAKGAPVIDLRRPDEIAQTGLVEGAVNILHTEIDAIAALIGESKDRAVILYCRSGRRVASAIEALEARGFGGLVNAGGYSHLTSALQGE